MKKIMVAFVFISNYLFSQDCDICLESLAHPDVSSIFSNEEIKERMYEMIDESTYRKFQNNGQLEVVLPTEIPTPLKGNWKNFYEYRKSDLQRRQREYDKSASLKILQQQTRDIGYNAFNLCISECMQRSGFIKVKLTNNSDSMAVVSISADFEGELGQGFFEIEAEMLDTAQGRLSWSKDSLVRSGGRKVLSLIKKDYNNTIFVTVRVNGQDYLVDIPPPMVIETKKMQSKLCFSLSSDSDAEYYDLDSLYLHFVIIDDEIEVQSKKDGEGYDNFGKKGDVPLINQTIDLYNKISGRGRYDFDLKGYNYGGGARIEGHWQFGRFEKAIYYFNTTPGNPGIRTELSPPSNLTLYLRRMPSCPYK